MRKASAGRVPRALVWALLMTLALAGGAWAQTGTPLPETAVPATAVPQQVSIVVQLTAGTAGWSLPASIPLKLYGFDGQTQALTAQGAADAAGKYRFEGVAYQEGRTYGVTATVDGTVYATALTPVVAAGSTELNLDLKVFAATTDRSGLQIDQMYVMLQFPSENQVQVTQAYRVTNTSDRAVQGAETSPDGEPGSLRFDLPAGATQLEFANQDGSGYLPVDGGFLYLNPVRPGAGPTQAVVAYTLPYTGQLQLKPAVRYPVQTVNVLLADQGVTLAAGPWTEQGTRNAPDGANFRVYAAGPFKAGELIAVDVSGTPSLATAAPPESAPAAQAAPSGPAADRSKSASEPDVFVTARAIIRENSGPGLWLALLGIIVMLGSAAYWLLRNRAERLAADPLRRTRALVAAVADLDEDRARGKIGEDEYVRRRARLAEALRLWLDKPDPEAPSAAEAVA